MRQIVLDTETTGLSVKDGHKIIEIAAVELINRKLTGKHFHQYIRPLRPIDPGAQAVHGITEAFLADKPLFHEIIMPLLSFIKDAELIIHNAPFDVSFLDYEFQQAGSQFQPITAYCSILDTLQLARKKHPGQQNSLDALCKRYEVDNSNRQLHGALVDTHLLAEVYLAMTGGQTSLFGDVATDTVTVANVAIENIVENAKPTKIRIIPATADELVAHQLRLQKLKEAHGLCLWVEEPEPA